MKKWMAGAAAAALVVTMTACSNGDGGSASDKVIAESKVGNITEAELYNVMKDRFGTPMLRQLLVEKVLSDKYKVDDKEVQAELDELKAQYPNNFEQVLLSSGYKSEDDLKKTIRLDLLQKKAAEKDVKVTDEEAKKAYDEAQKQESEIRASHILVKTEKEAKDIIAKIEKGEDFAELAKKHSTDGS
ncbi:MAG: peptidylprolyl isomerase, partial [Bacilli bacterium]